MFLLLFNFGKYVLGILLRVLNGCLNFQVVVLNFQVCSCCQILVLFSHLEIVKDVTKAILRWSLIQTR